MISDSGSVNLLIPLHIPQGALLAAVVVHVKPGGAVKLTLRVLRNDALAGASGDQQTVLGTAQSDGTANEQDISLTGLSEAVPRGEAATQQAYYAAIESGQAADEFYTGYAKFGYTELLLGM